MDALSYLTFLAIILLGGLLFTLLSNKLKIPNVILLVIFGLLLQLIRIDGENIIAFPASFVTSIAILALIIIVFHGSSQFKLRDFDTFSIEALKVFLVFLILNAVFLSVLTNFLFNLDLGFAIIFSVVMSSTAADAVLSMIKTTSENKNIKILQFESFLNTPFIVLLPFLILGVMGIQADPQGNFISLEGAAGISVGPQIALFFQQILTGFGAGLLIGIILFKALKKQYNNTLAQIAVVVGALLAYVMAENLQGNGVLAVITLGVFFGTSHVREKSEFSMFSSFFSETLEILVFVLVGLIFFIPGEFSFFVKSLILYIAYLVIRYIAILVTLGKTSNTKERLFMTLVAPKGIAVATLVLVFIASLGNFEGSQTMINLMMIFLFYSLIIASITIKFSKYFIRENVVKVDGKNS